MDRRNRRPGVSNTVIEAGIQATAEAVTRQPVGGLYLFVWVIPTIDEAIATHSRLENIASIIAILLAFILLALLHVIWALGHIHAALVLDVGRMLPV